MRRTRNDTGRSRAEGLLCPSPRTDRSVLLYGNLCSYWAADLAPDPRALAVVGMAAFFTAVVRSPLTGIVLVIELRGNPRRGGAWPAVHRQRE